MYKLYVYGICAVVILIPHKWKLSVSHPLPLLMSYSHLSLSFILQSSATEKAARFCHRRCGIRLMWLWDVESVRAGRSKETKYLSLFCSILSFHHGSLEWESHGNYYAGHLGTFQRTVGDTRRLVTFLIKGDMRDNFSSLMLLLHLCGKLIHFN